MRIKVTHRRESTTYAKINNNQTPVGTQMKYTLWLSFVLLLILTACAQPAKKTMDQPDLKQINQQVKTAENAFAQTMADRDFTAFAEFVAEDAVFFAGDQPLRGKAAVLKAWAPFYQGEQAPFSWHADVVEAHASGHLVLSNGPVYNSEGQLFARFNSVWQLQADGRWQVIFDKGTSLAELQPQNK